MRIVGVLDKDIRIVDGIGAEKVPKLKDKFDFIWLDIDRFGSKEHKIVQEVFGLPSATEGDYPIVVTGDLFDTVVLNYYEELYRRYLFIYYSKSFLITIHRRPSSAVEEAMASLNELLVTGNLSSERILYQLVLGIMTVDDTEIRSIEENFRNFTEQLKAGGVDINKLFFIYKKAKSSSKVLSKTKDLILDISSKRLESKFIENPTIFKGLYTDADNQSRRIDDLCGILDDLTYGLIPSIWEELSSTRRIVGGLIGLSIALSLATLFKLAFPEKFMGLNSWYLVFLIIGIGAIAAILTQFSPSSKVNITEI